MIAAALANLLEARGFQVRVWKEKRVYIDGYGHDIRAFIEPSPADHDGCIDRAIIDVRSTWRSPLAGMRAKGVKHELLMDLYRSGFLTKAPPENWKDVTLDRRVVHPRLEPPAEQPLPFDWPPFTQRV